MATFGGTYSTGTISVTADDTTVTGVGTLWDSIAEQGDWLYADGNIGIIETVTDDTHLELELGWAGTTLSGENYRLIKMSWLRYEPALTQKKVRELLEKLATVGIIYYVTGSEPDPLIGDDGNLAVKTSVTPWLWWIRASGVWEATASASAGATDGLFHKADWRTVAFTKTGAGTISIKVGTKIELAGTVYAYTVASAVQMPTLNAGTDYAIYQCDDGTLRADASFSAPSGFSTTTSRQIGGFHYAPGGNAPAQAGGDTTAAINEYSIWDLKFRPAASDPRGMTLVAGRFWCDIYLLGVNHHTDGTSRHGATIADWGSPPKIPTAFGGNGSTTYGALTWWIAAEVLAAYGKDLLCYGEFAAAAYGVTENESVGADPGTTGRDAARTSKWGVMQATGSMWIWGRDLGGPYNTTAAWQSDTGGRGQTHNLANAVLLGGTWNAGAYSGSRASRWSIAPWNSSTYYGARGRCDHLCHV